MDEDRAREAERIGRLIAELRLSHGWSQEDLAGETGIRVGTISRLERGRHQATTKNVQKLAKAFGVAPSLLSPPAPELETQLDRIEALLSQLVDDREAQAAFRVELSRNVLEVMKRLDAMTRRAARPRGQQQQ